MEMNFVVECYFDTVLIKSLLGVRKVNHQSGCDNVIKHITTSIRLKDDFAVAVIDADKKQLKFVRDECDEIHRTQHLVLLKHRSRQHYVIKLVPAIERWVLHVAKEGNIEVKDLNLPNDLKGIRDRTKFQYAHESDELQRLCQRLAESESSTIGTLKSWLKHLHQHNRNADIKTLQNV